MRIDLRSDTLTKPTKEMLEVMFNAEVGDDVFEEDPTVNTLEAKVAAMFGKEAAIFCPSGTMTNQIAIKAHTVPGDEVICHELCHVYKYEGGGIASNSGASVRLISGNRGRISPDQIIPYINPDNVHFPVTTLVTLEDTSNKGGGCYYKLEDIQEISNICQENNLKLHLDGARMFNGLVETGYDYKTYAANFDSISICLSKGLGIPVGSVLLGTKELVRKARRIRKAFGGGMRQAGYIAAAGIYALDNNIDRLKEDHKRAKVIEEVLNECSYVKEVLPVATNIIVFELAGGWTDEAFLKKLEEHNVCAVPFGKNIIRFVTHLDFNDDHLNELIKVLKSI